MVCPLDDSATQAESARLRRCVTAGGYAIAATEEENLLLDDLGQALTCSHTVKITKPRQFYNYIFQKHEIV